MLDEEIHYEITEGIVRGAVIAGGTLSAPLATRVFGHAGPGSSPLLRADSIIDMASVSKAVATTTALLIARDRGLLDFDRPFTDYLPQYQAVLPNPISIRDLAMHISGFSSQAHYTAPTAAEIRNNLLSVSPPGKYGQYEYSCWNFHLLSMIIEQVAKTPFDVFCQEQIFLPLGMTETTVGKPCAVEPERLVQTCATEKAGQISDFVAARMYREGFTAGNAGVFSCASDLAKFCRCLLQQGLTPSGKHLFSREGYRDISTAKMFSGKVERSFGWIVNDDCKPSGLSKHTIYHSGWSGQTVFMDLERQFYAIVLTTRTLEEYDQAKTGRFKIVAELAKECRVLDE